MFLTALIFFSYGNAITAKSLPAEVPLCMALDSIQPGQQVQLRTSGVYAVGFEQQDFYDPAHPMCPADVQPFTWIEFAPGVGKNDELDRILRKSHRALLSVVGTLVGPRELKPDDFASAPIVSYIDRTQGRRYGHLGGYRAKLIVNQLLSVSEVPGGMAEEPAILRKVPVPDLEVVAGAIPRVPRALRSGITGTVLVQVTVKRGRVDHAVALTGDRMLATDAVEDVKTWTFRNDTDASFTTEFIYALERRGVNDDPAPRIELDLPIHVRITAASKDW